MIPQLPRLIYESLSKPPAAASDAIHDLAAAQRARNRWLTVIAALLAALVVALVRQSFSA